MTPDAILQALRTARDGLVAWAQVPSVLVRTGVLGALNRRGAAVALDLWLHGRAGLGAALRLWARNSPAKLALVSGERSFTYEALDREVDAVAAGLERAGIGRGTTALVALRNRPEAIVLLAAIGRAGGTVALASWRSTAPEVEDLLRASGAGALFFDVDAAGAVATVAAAGGAAGGSSAAALAPGHLVSVGGRVPGARDFAEIAVPGGASAGEAEGEAPAIVICTSGTTGLRKPAERRLTPEAAAAGARFVGATPLRHDDVHLVVCPLYHSAALGFAGMAFGLGATVVVTDGFEAEAFLSAVERHRVTTTVVVPTMLYRLVGLGREAIHRHDTSSLRAVFCGGAPLRADVATAALDALGDVVHEFYGATETGLVTLATPDDLRVAPGTMGRALPGGEVRLLDEAGREVPDGEVGELFARSPLLFQGYRGDPAATHAAARDGLFSVGDLARRDARGYYFFEGRKVDMINSGGVKVHALEVERTLESHPDVAEAAVVGVPDPEWGERVEAFVVLREAARATPADLERHAAARLAGPKRPRGHALVPALPRNWMGKIDKRKLAALAAAASAGGACGRSR